MYWQRIIVNYNRHEYNAGSQNWMIDQHANGWLYFANNKGLLEYDGKYWNCYSIPYQAKMRSVKTGANNQIFVGGLKEFGIFTPNNRGGLDYKSLSAGINSHTVSNIWNIHIAGKKVYFQGDRYFFCYENGKVTPIDADGIDCSGYVNHRLYYNNYKGVSWVNGKKTIFIPHSQMFNSTNIVAYLPYQGQVLIVTPEQGLYLYNGKGFIKPFPIIDQELSGHRVTCAAINGNSLAIGTVDDGLQLFNLANSQVEKINIMNGLQNKSLLSLAFDHANNLWLGLDNGIDYVVLNSNVFFLSSKLSDIGAGYCSQYYQNKLYLGTNQGINETNIPTSINTPTYMKKLSGLSGLTHCLYPYDGKLFCGGRNFFAMIDGSQIHKYERRGVWHVQPIGQDDNTLLLGTYWGLEIMRKQNGNWNLTNTIASVKHSAKTMFVEPESGNVWLANKSEGIWRITLDTRYTKALHQKNYNNSHLPKGDNVFVGKIGKDIIVASRQGLFRYDDNKDALLPDHKLEQKLDGNCSYTYFKQERDGRIWYVANGILKCLNRNGQKKSYWKDLMIEDFEDVYSPNNQQSIVSTEDGFVLIDLAMKLAPKPKLQPLVRKLFITSGKDSLVYFKSIVDQHDDIRIDYRNNSIRIEYGCNYYNSVKAISYSYRLKGYNKHWSDYTTATTKEYTDLPEGTYTFELKLRPDSENKAVETSITFTILPPWYRTWWAYTIYVLLFLGAIYYSYDRYKKGRERLIRMKDAEMKRQKTVLERDLDEKKKQISKLEEEKLRTELNYKSDELAKTTLNVVRKNEILQRIKKDAENLSRTINEGNLVSIRRGMLRLITQIDTNIEHDSDLDNFQSSFDAVHNDFFKKLDTLYPQLTNKDKMLCAYIKMNLMSKEIAPLLNISVRGVEISRYRLRKKLGLDEKDNLAEFLQKLE